ncbi:hypothetical protein CREGCYN_10360 [Synechococcus sp. M16CYN]
MDLPLHFQFEKQQLQGTIEKASDISELKNVAGLLLDLYFRQRVATAQIIADKS